MIRSTRPTKAKLLASNCRAAEPRFCIPLGCGVSIGRSVTAVSSLFGRGQAAARPSCGSHLLVLIFGPDFEFGSLATDLGQHGPQGDGVTRQHWAQVIGLDPAAAIPCRAEEFGEHLAY